jgi:hypothetical protein
VTDDIAEEETEDNVNEVGEVVEAEEGEMVEYIAVNQDDQLLHSDITIKVKTNPSWIYHSFIFSM